MTTRVVVTGVGMVTPVGLSTRETWENLKAGRSGIDRITAFDTTGMTSTVAGQVHGFEPERHMERKEARRTSRFTQLAFSATQEALAQSGLKISPANADDVGILISAAIGGLQEIESAHSALLERGPGRVSPFTVPMMISDMAAGQIAISTGAKGPNYSIASACASSGHSVGEAFEIIRRGDAVAMLAGGAESTITPLAMASFCAIRAVSTWSGDPHGASRPFDLKRDGFVMGEGAAVLVLEELEHARARGAPILAEIIGYAATADANHITAPDPQGRGAAKCMERALRKAGIGAEAVSYVNAHGTATPLGDVAETLAIKSVLGERAHRIPVNSTKSMIGHLLGAAGAVEAAVCVCSLVEGVVHPTINLEYPDPQCDLDYVVGGAREVDVQVAMSNSFGFGGHNATLVLRKYAPTTVNGQDAPTR
jgi:3-oxoacyl-[acyl-carrier-protein] synthase II